MTPGSVLGLVGGLFHSNLH